LLFEDEILLLEPPTITEEFDPVILLTEPPPIKAQDVTHSIQLLTPPPTTL
jgi:hypothetical protein